MTEEEQDRLLDIRKRGKRKPVSPEEHEFCIRMWEQYPEEYSAVERRMQAWLRTASWWEIL